MCLKGKKDRVIFQSGFTLLLFTLKSENIDKYYDQLNSDYDQHPRVAKLSNPKRQSVQNIVSKVK
jgi:hypothetical protein